MVDASSLSVWVGDGLVDPQQPTIRAYDHGVTVGDGVFETCVVRDGVPFALTRHLRRLATSARGLGLTTPDDGSLRDAVAAVLQDQARRRGEPLAHGRLRITVTGGAGPLGSDRGNAVPTLLVLASPVPRPDPSAAVHVVPWVRNERSAVAGLKTTSYADNVVALAAAHEHGASEALFANTRDELCEGTGSNVVLVIGDEVVTPPLSSGCLAGITRELLLEWASADAVAVVERPVALTELARADELMLTSSTRDVQPVHRVDDRELTPGPVGRQLTELFRRHAAADLDP
ncbi:MAG TPA: aminodeoxychorismate lyase [Actinomycetales bacterium]|nr:aminodeoxychorismate lyase [Actinomycetales bacterium]